MDAVGSALDVAAGLGMDVIDPQSLRSTNNTVIWLRPTPVVAKVAQRGTSCWSGNWSSRPLWGVSGLPL